MPLKNHYIPQVILKGFSVHNHINVVLIDSHKAGFVTSSGIFHKRGLYPNEFETLLNKNLETPLEKLLTNLNGTNEIRLTKDDVELLKKYIMLQSIRTKSAKESNLDSRNNPPQLMNLQRAKYDDLSQGWELAVKNCIESNWHQCVNSDYIIISENAKYLDASKMVLLHTKSEFIISGSGRTQVNVPCPSLHEVIENKIKKKYDLDSNTRPLGWILSFQLFPLSSNLAIGVYNPDFDKLLEYIEKSLVADHDLQLLDVLATIYPKSNNSHSKKLIKTEINNRTSDTFNILTIKQSDYGAIAFKTPKCFYKTIDFYSTLPLSPGEPALDLEWIENDELWTKNLTLPSEYH